MIKHSSHKRDTVIQIEGLSKLYRLGQVGTTTLGDDLTRWWYRIRGKGDPFAVVGQTNNRSEEADGDYVWAIRDINLEIKRGQRLGIIGANGAGKSTLLKILSKVTGPTTGSLKVKGRLASLLEVGTGFHPEMTGRENIFMNGAILGMTRREIKQKLDDIVDFAGVARYLDTPVKRYSSGMTVRLGFAVAAHLEPDILVVDEVLAVGDAEFQKRAIGKMNEVSSQEGRTILFVSHNLAAVQRLCDSAILVSKGEVKKTGSVEDVIASYQAQDGLQLNHSVSIAKPDESTPVYASRVWVDGHEGSAEGRFLAGEHWHATIKLVVQEPIQGVRVALGIRKQGATVQVSWSDPLTLDPGEYELRFIQDDVLLTPGRYALTVSVRFGMSIRIQHEDDIADFEILQIQNNDRSLTDTGYGFILNPMSTTLSAK